MNTPVRTSVCFAWNIRPPINSPFCRSAGVGMQLNYRRIYIGNYHSHYPSRRQDTQTHKGYSYCSNLLPPDLAYRIQRKKNAILISSDLFAFFMMACVLERQSAPNDRAYCRRKEHTAQCSPIQENNFHFSSSLLRSMETICSRVSEAFISQIFREGVLLPAIIYAIRM